MIYVVVILWSLLALMVHIGYDEYLVQIPLGARLIIMLINFIFAPPIALFSIIGYYIEQEGEEEPYDF